MEVFSLLLSLFNSVNSVKSQNISNYIRTRTRTSNTNIEENCMLDKSKSSVQCIKSTRNRTRVFPTELNKRVHESKQ